jgi:hypothetical protein
MVFGLYRILAGTTKMNLRFGKILNQETETGFLLHLLNMGYGSVCWNRTFIVRFGVLTVLLSSGTMTQSHPKDVTVKLFHLFH